MFLFLGLKRCLNAENFIFISFKSNGLFFICHIVWQKYNTYVLSVLVGFTRSINPAMNIVGLIALHSGVPPPAEGWCDVSLGKSSRFTVCARFYPPV